MSRKKRELPHVAKGRFDFRSLPICGAKTRRKTLCQQPAMKNGRCYWHGGMSTGPPKGSQNALKHGHYTAKAIAERKAISRLFREMENSLKEI